jgi:hypothetical protein
VALSPQANYTDWATATCRRNLVLTFVDRGVLRGQRGGSRTVVNLSFLDRRSVLTNPQMSEDNFREVEKLFACLSRWPYTRIELPTDRRP